MLKVDLSYDRLIQTAERLIDARDYMGALKILNKNCELNDDDGYAHLLYAQIFDDVGLFERSVNEWFKFLAFSDYVDGDELDEAYEGLAVGFMNVGNEQFSAYYYNKLLKNSGDIPDEVRSTLMESFLSREENPLKFVYPPEIADCSGIIADGVGYMKDGEFEKAAAEFKKVNRHNKDYNLARNYLAMSYIINDKIDEAEQICNELIGIKPDDVHAMTTLVAVKTEQGKRDESKQLAEKLLKLDISSSDDIFKIATVCCENGMHEEAYNQLCKLEQKLPFDPSVLYFKAISAFNCGKYKECFDAFDKIITVDKNAVIAKYYREQARIAVKKGDTAPMSYFYRMPKKERESELKLLAVVSAMSNKQIKQLFEELDISDCVRWCFDEGENNTELQFLGAMCAVKGRIDDVVCDILLDAFQQDELKIRMLFEIGKRNEDLSLNVVFCNVLKTVDFYKLKIGRIKRKNFVGGYAQLTSRFGILDDGLSERFALAAERLYAKLESEQKLYSVGSASEIAAAVLLYSKIKLPKLSRRNEICKYFRVDSNEIFDRYGV